MLKFVRSLLMYIYISVEHGYHNAAFGSTCFHLHNMLLIGTLSYLVNLSLRIWRTEVQDHSLHYILLLKYALAVSIFTGNKNSLCIWRTELYLSLQYLQVSHVNRLWAPSAWTIKQKTKIKTHCSPLFLPAAK